MSPRYFVVALMGVALLQTHLVYALGLMEAYDAALQNDSAYRAALAEGQSGQEHKIIGRSYLMPSMSANYTLNANFADIATENNNGAVASEYRKYWSQAGSIQARQPLFNLDSLARYRQGIAKTKASETELSLSRQDLILRLFSLYATANYAEDQLALAVAQRDSYTELQRTNNRLFAQGEGTQTDMIETQAKFDLSEAQLLESQDSLSNARNALSSMVGREVSQLSPLRENFRVLPMQPASFEEWKTIALEQNLELATQRYAIEVAQQEINKTKSGHAPRLDGIASLSRNKSDTTSTIKQDAMVTSAGVQLTIPIFSGGAVNAANRQARAQHEKAQANLQTKTNEVVSELHKQFSAVSTSVLRIEALAKSADSARLLIDATQKSVKGGIRTNLDVLNAQRQLFEVKRDLALARYNYLIGYLRLRKAAGNLSVNNLQAVADYFEK